MSVADRVVAALADVEGLRPAVERSWGSAVDLTPDAVQVRLIATRLPLPPLLARAAAVVRPVLADTEWAGATLRLIVTDVDAGAFS
ncbi:hypothetical protein ABZU76_05460 [Amycolatopsis sp. NPDC005232]|uniref:hypothetical protein n=1 Tax=Amycolatopsis sp. NPDC005232 TaxID=3157027 RepID=UPI0033B1FE37